MKEISTFLEENSDATMNSSLEAKGIVPNNGEHQHVGSRVSRTSASSDDSYCSSIPSGDTHYYYFYQGRSTSLHGLYVKLNSFHLFYLYFIAAEDGQYIFLHQVNARCLIKVSTARSKHGLLFSKLVVASALCSRYHLICHERYTCASLNLIFKCMSDVMTVQAF